MHKLDYVFYVIDGGFIGVYDEADQHVGTLELASGDSVALYPHGKHLRAQDGTTSTLPAYHSAKNIGDTVYREILIETKS